MVAPIYIPTNSKQGFSFLYILVWQIFWLKAPQREYPLLWKEPLPLLQNHYFKIGPPGWRGRWEGGSGWGIHVTPWLIHVNVWQNPWKCCEVISLQPIKKKKKWTSSMGSDYPALGETSSGTGNLFHQKPAHLIFWLSSHEKFLLYQELKCISRVFFHQYYCTPLEHFQTSWFFFYTLALLILRL